MIKQILLRSYDQINRPEMVVYLWFGFFIFGLSVIYDIVCSRIPEHRPLFRTIFCVLVTISLALFCGLRHISVGTDTERYSVLFSTEHHITPMKIIGSLMPGAAKKMDQGEVPKDATFYLISDLLQSAGFSPNGHICFYALFYIGVTGFLIYRYSTEPPIAFFAFMALGTYTFGFTGIRQAIAMAFTGLAFPYIEKKKLIPFLFFVFLAMLFHKSAIVFIPTWFFCRRKITVRHLIIIGAASALLYFEYPLVSRFVFTTFSEMDSRISYFGEEVSYRSFAIAMIRASILIIFLIARGKQPYTPRETVFVNIYIISVIMEIGAVAGGAAFARIGLYFGYFATFIVPLAVDSICVYKPKARPLIYGTTYAVLVLFFAKYMSILGRFHFFWEGWQTVGS